MSDKTEYRSVLVTRKTRLEELIERFNTWPQAKFYLEHNGISVSDYLQEHDTYKARVLEAEQCLRAAGRLQKIERSYLPSYQFSSDEIVVVIGQDGLVANTLKYLSGQPVIGINPDPARWDGKLLPFETEDLPAVFKETLLQRRSTRSITFAQATTNDGQQMLAVNDLFIGPKSHTSARYELRWGARSEVQSSSGIIISTGLGSSGWFQSILSGAMGVTGEQQHALRKGFGWDEQRLQFTVREPFPSRTTGTQLVFGAITAAERFLLESHMPMHGVVFSDGIEEDFLEFNAGMTLEISVADTSGHLVI
ncbi:sugar kinase [Allohahella marinimesophila]|uniref:NAD(+)/NADH kinase n=1 Tax=Allohahella marinimesophila TaxID=1054972 RepID=A0ABP7PVV1_9GAMM